MEGIKGLNQTLKNLKQRADYLARETVDEVSKDIATDAQKNFSRFAREVSADDRFVNVHREKHDDYTATVVCVGEQVLFIEFGVGIHFYSSGRSSDEAQPRPAGIVHIGHYGKGYGMDDYWVRPAKSINRSAGETAVLDRNGNERKGVAWTMGHRPARALWRARFSAIQKLKERIGRFK